MRGFTLIEILLVLGIVSIVTVAGTITGIRDFTRGICVAEARKAVSLLTHARSRALSGYRGTSHGLHFGEEQYFLFSGESFENGNPMNEATPRESSLPIVSPGDVVFRTLTGDVNESAVGEIVVGGEDYPCQENISIGHGGQISL
jgi:prepilin-type N-terminal cleavage/methylation domain-containing protein